MLKLLFNREETIDVQTAASLEMANITLRGRVEQLLEQDMQRKMRCHTVLCDKAARRIQNYYN